jgi:uncharacterized protein YcfL
MKKLLLVFPLFLAACGTDSVVVTSTRQQVVMPEEAMFNCPTVDQLPATRNLTDVQVARLIVQLYQNNTTCKNSMTTLRKFLEDAKNTTNATQERK